MMLWVHDSCPWYLRTAMNFTEILRQTFAMFRAHKMRMFLTMFGIVWGISSVILLVGLGGAVLLAGIAYAVYQWWQNRPQAKPRARASQARLRASSSTDRASRTIAGVSGTCCGMWEDR